MARLNAHPDAMVLFSGDALAPSLLSTVTKGEHMVKMLNLMNIRAACMGNHDFDYGVDVLQEAVVESNFPWMLSNAWDRETGERFAGAHETVMVEHRGRKFGLMGLIEEEWLATLATLEREDIIYKDYVDVARHLCAQLRAEGADAVIALTHMRTPNDRRLALEVPELDLILGGHDHEVFADIINGVTVIKSGTDFRNFTSITVCFTDTPAGEHAAADIMAHRPAAGDTDGSTRKCVCSWRVEDVMETDAKDSAAEELVKYYQEELNRSMDRKIGELGVAMDATFAHIRTQETNCSNWVADCILHGLSNQGHRVDCVIVNSGTLRADDVFPPGAFLMKDLVTLLPMLDELCVLELTGSQLLEALENGVSMYPKLEGAAMPLPCARAIREGVPCWQLTACCRWSRTLSHCRRHPLHLRRARACQRGPRAISLCHRRGRAARSRKALQCCNEGIPGAGSRWVHRVRSRQGARLSRLCLCRYVCAPPAVASDI